MPKVREKKSTVKDEKRNASNFLCFPHCQVQSLVLWMNFHPVTVREEAICIKHSQSLCTKYYFSYKSHFIIPPGVIQIYILKGTFNPSWWAPVDDSVISELLLKPQCSKSDKYGKQEGNICRNSGRSDGFYYNITWGLF